MTIITKTEVEARVRELQDRRLQTIYRDADNMVLETADTLSDEFQLAALIQRLFWDYFESRYDRLSAG